MTIHPSLAADKGWHLGRHRPEVRRRAPFSPKHFVENPAHRRELQHTLSRNEKARMGPGLVDAETMPRGPGGQALIPTRMHPKIRRDLARLSQLDHMHGRRVAAFRARPAFQRGLGRWISWSRWPRSNAAKSVK
jgi:hypothetical protein